MSKRILIVDDEPDLVDVLSILFRASGYDTVAAADGLAALEAVRRVHPDLVLMDVMMPRMNGYEACRRLKTEPETERLPVVMLSARAHDTDKHAGLEAGADAYMAKPFDNHALLAKVRELIGKA